jgi:hypothetical protein
MKTRPLTLQIPKPDSDGCCNIHCPNWRENINRSCFCAQFLERIVSLYKMKPGPGCPWYDGGKDE